jgi:hypothetical protein
MHTFDNDSEKSESTESKDFSTMKKRPEHLEHLSKSPRPDILQKNRCGEDEEPCGVLSWPSTCYFFVLHNTPRRKGEKE